jgi:hypothetical protein
MNKENEEGLDELFKRKLENPVDKIRFEEGDWYELEQMLDKPKRKGIIWLLPVLSGVAALLLLFLGWWAFRPKTETHSNKNQSQATTHKTINTVIEKQANTHSRSTDTIIEMQSTARRKASDTIKKHKSVQQPFRPVQNTPSSATYTIKDNSNKLLLSSSSGKFSKDTIIKEAIGINNQGIRTDAELIAINSVPVFARVSTPIHPVKQIDLPRPAYSSSISSSIAKNIKVKPRKGFRPQYAISVVAAPDLNGVGSFQQSKVGTNVGLTFAVGLSKKLTISTGALYSVKPYTTNFNNYNIGSTYKWPVNPSNVIADCRMLDIPLNVAYEVYHKQQNKIAIGTGLSSYVMLHERYKFIYDYAATAGPLSYTVPNPGKYFFGVINLNATYERQINSKIGISIQPYLKLPLSNVGYGQVKLQTTGVAVGFSWNLNSLTKP